jgi:hypothetical protein
MGPIGSAAAPCLAQRLPFPQGRGLTFLTATVTEVFELRFFNSAVGVAVAIGLLAGCSGNNLGSPSSSLPNVGQQSSVRGLVHAPRSLVDAWMLPAGIARLRLNTHDVPMPAKKSKSLIYASNFYQYEMWGYPNPNKSNGPATCTIGSSSKYMEYVNGFGTDTKGNVLVPGYTGQDSGYLAINVFKPSCGAEIWQAKVDTGQPADAYAVNGATGTVLVGLLADYDNNDYGASVLCSAKSGCGTPLTNSSVTGYVAGIAMAKNGDCWQSGATSTTSGFVLVYFKGCTGSGEVATGTSNASYGGLFIDTKGNLGSLDSANGVLYVYSGCNPACTLVSTTTLHGDSLFGGLDSKGTSLALGDYANNEIDVYSYSTTKGATYSYSFNNGLTSGSENLVETGHFAPRNKKV